MGRQWVSIVLFLEHLRACLHKRFKFFSNCYWRLSLVLITFAKHLDITDIVVLCESYTKLHISIHNLSCLKKYKKKNLAKEVSIPTIWQNYKKWFTFMFNSYKCCYGIPRGKSHIIQIWRFCSWHRIRSLWDNCKCKIRNDMFYFGRYALSIIRHCGKQMK